MKNYNSKRESTSPLKYSAYTQDYQNAELTKAFSIIKNELKKKDQRIQELENEVAHLKTRLQIFSPSVEPFEDHQTQNNKLHSLSYTSNTVNNNLYNINSNLTSKFLENQLNDINSGMNYSHQNNKKNFPLNYTPQTNASNRKNNNYFQNIPSRAQYDSDNERIIKVSSKINFPMQSTGNSFVSNDTQAQSKNEVKAFLKEVRSKVSQGIFKEFIKDIKLLTSKNPGGSNRNAIISNVRQLFGNEHKDLYDKFENILGIKK